MRESWRETETCICVTLVCDSCTHARLWVIAIEWFFTSVRVLKSSNCPMFPNKLNISVITVRFWRPNIFYFYLQNVVSAAYWFNLKTKRKQTENHFLQLLSMKRKRKEGIIKLWLHRWRNIKPVGGRNSISLSDWGFTRVWSRAGQRRRVENKSRWLSNGRLATIWLRWVQN